jgi:hypothetical protein
MLKLRHEDASPDHFQVYSGEVRIGTIYRTPTARRGARKFVTVIRVSPD